MFLDYFALGCWSLLPSSSSMALSLFTIFPTVMARHPHQDAIHYAGWVSLFTLHAIWPFLWIWATIWRKERGWGFKD